MIGFGLARQSRARCPCLPQLWHFRDSFLGLTALFGRRLVLMASTNRAGAITIHWLATNMGATSIALFLAPLKYLLREEVAELPMCDVVRARRVCVVCVRRVGECESECSAMLNLRFLTQ